MVKIAFKTFGCLTVILFLGGAGALMAMKAVVPAPRISHQVRTVVYPLAVESAKVKFQKTIQSMSAGYPRQTLVFTELEANAFLDRAVNNSRTQKKHKNFPVKNPYIFFLEDAMRVHFDLALLETFWMFSNQFKGMAMNENIEDLARRESGTSRISFTIDFELIWVRDHPQIRVRKAYIGVLPVPLLSLFNHALQPMNNWFANDFGKSSKLDNFAVRGMKFADKEFAVDMETMVTEEYQKEMRRRRVAQAMSAGGGKADPFSNYLGGRGPCNFACTDRERENLVRAIEDLNKQNTMNPEDLRKAQRMREEFKSEPQPRP
jgi:hypothetical protein